MGVRFFSRRKVPRKNALFQFAQRVLRRLPALQGSGEINIVFVSDREIQSLNRRFLGENRTTDVIAFSYDRRNHARDAPFGDIYVSIDSAKKEAARGGYALVCELALLLVHGLLHLAGYDDHSARDKARMWKAQKRLLRASGGELAPPDFQS